MCIILQFATHCWYYLCTFIRQIFVKFIAVLYISYNENYSVGAIRTGIEKCSKVQEVLESH